MFQRCVLRLDQKDNWLEVVIRDPRSLHVPKYDDEEGVNKWRELVTRYPIEGKWRIGKSSVSEKPDDAYTIGTSAPPSQKWWRWGFPGFSNDGSLEFVETASWIGGGLGFGEVYDDVTTTLTLYGAKLTDYGVEPIDVNRARGTVFVASNVFKKSPGELMDLTWGVVEYDVKRS
jgi:hypothetical protein